jgi:hypothetical protein
MPEPMQLDAALSATPDSPSRVVRACLLGLAALAVWRYAVTLVAVAKRVMFPYDFGVWPDEYLLNGLVKLRFGAPIYGSYDDANSFIYTPAVVALHHAVLAPFGLDLDIVANRMLAQVWLLLAVALGMRLVIRTSQGALPGRALAIAGTLGAFATLALAAYSNPVADTIHPAMLELVWLGATGCVVADWPRFSPRMRTLLALLVPACAMLAKQTGVSAAFALAAVALWSGSGSRRQRLGWAAAALISPVLAFVALELATRGAFARWGLFLPLRQPKITVNLLFLPAVLAEIAPVLVLVSARVEHAFERRGEETHAAWLRVASVPIAYLPFAMLAFLKIGGGAFDFGAVAFFAAVLALAQVRTALTTRNAGVFGAWLVVPLAAAQLVLWSPRRPVPDAAKVAFGSRICSHVAEALACGERVLLDGGMVCLIHGGITTVPRDRGFTIMELAWGNLRDAGGTARRLASEQYDLVMLHAIVPPGPWSKRALEALDRHYTMFQSLAPPATLPDDDLDLNERARLENWPTLGMLLFERKRDAGRHRSEIIGPRACP